MKIRDLSTSGDKATPSELMRRRLEVERAGGSDGDFVREFDFDSADEVEQAVRLTIMRATEDAYFRDNENRKNDTSTEVLYRKGLKLRTSAGSFEKYTRSIATEQWANYFAPRHRSELIRAAFEFAPNPAAYRLAAASLANVYGFTQNDIEKLRFFCCQVKAGEMFPKSLRRMLYLWGTAKQTGKTTTAETLAAILNGEEAPAPDNFKTTLSREMQIDAYAVPIVTECRCAVMDEAFYRDMGKTYSKFKSMLTGTGGTARLPYGQTFVWHGLPNYIATSNEPLNVFIKDWGDRRYLSVNFTAKPKKLKPSELWDLWSDFAKNAELPSGEDFDSWGEKIAPLAEEEGEKGVNCSDYEVYIRGEEFRKKIENGPNVSHAHNDNRLTGLKVCNMLGEVMHDYTARDHRSEIEAAFERVYGPKDTRLKCWFFDYCREIQRDEDRQTYGTDETTDPF